MGTPRFDLLGQTFGRWTALEYVGGKRAKWLCKCKCGTECEVAGGNLKQGITKSCGCLKRERLAERRIDLAGQVFGRLTAITFVGGDQFGWQCKCSCGTTCEVDGGKLRSGHTQSCGCLRREVTRQRLTTHGLTNHALYDTWIHIKDRCYNPNHKCYHRYGGRGITVCDRWRDDFAAFLADVGERPPGLSLDRIDNNGNYCPENTRWATSRVQNSNRDTNNQAVGVSFDRRNNKYAATIKIARQSVFLGYYKQHSDAAYQRLAYEALADQGADADHLKLLRKLIKAVTGNKPKVREPLYV